MKKLLFAAIIVLAVIGSAAFAQSPTRSAAESAANAEPQLTAAEEAEARAYVNQFCARLAETNSIGPLLDEYYTPDVVEQFKQEMLRGFADESDDEDTEDDSNADRGFWLKFDDSVWRRFLVDCIDALYLMALSAWNKEANGEESEFRDWISPRAQTKMRSNAHLADILDDDDEGGKFKNTSEVSDFLDTLDAAEAIMREDLHGATPALINGIRFMGEEPSTHELQFRVRVLTSPEFERPAGTHVIQMDLPIGVTLNLVRENGELRFLLPQMRD
jgi:hypothetical protein